MFTKFTAIAAAAIACTALPATARTTAPAPVPTQAVSPDQRICIVNDVTGSRIERKDCRTKAQWDKAGLDPLATAK